MKQIVLSISVIIILLSGNFFTFSKRKPFATNYYFANAGNDITGNGTIGNPYATISKANSLTLNPGDSVLFKCGDTFTGTIVPPASGSSGNSIIYSCYSTGALPKIEGFTTLTSWTNAGGGLYTKVFSGLLTLGVVRFDGAYQAMGRWPKLSASNSGYLLYQSHSGVASITSNAIASAASYVGGQVVIRAIHYNLDRGDITAQTSTTVTYSMITGGPINTPKDGFGFFFQNHVNACTVTGEYAYDSANTKISQFYSSGDPTTHTIEATTTDSAISVASRSWITFDRLNIDGANNYAAYLSGTCANIKFNADTFQYVGINAIHTVSSASNNITVNSCYFQYVNNIAISANQSTAWTVTSNTFKHIADVAGTALSGDQQGFVTTYLGNASTITDNVVDSAGYTVFHFSGNQMLFTRNLIQHFCLIKDDGGAIYTYQNNATVRNIIKNNIILYGVGAPNGTADSVLGGGAIGIYMDGYGKNDSIANNSIAYVQQYGILCNNPDSDYIVNNTIFSGPSGQQLYYTGGAQDAGTGTIGIQELTNATNPNVRGMIMKLNLTVVDTFLKTTLKTNTVNADIPSWWITEDSNYLCRPIDETTSWISARDASLHHQTLAQWKTYISSIDPHDSASWKSISSRDSLTFIYNATNATANISVGNKYYDFYRNSYTTGSISVGAYSSMILIYQGPLDPVQSNPSMPLTPTRVRFAINNKNIKEKWKQKSG